MINVVNCPHCNAQLFISDSGNRVDVLCSSCESRYLVTFAVVSMSTWDIEQPRSNRDQSKRIYDLRLMVQGQVQALRFSVPAQDTILNLMPNDELLLLHTQSRQQLALIQNKTVGWTSTFIVTQKGHIGKLIVAAVGFSVMGYAIGSTLLQGIVPAKYAPFVGLGVTTPIAFVLIKKRRRPSFIETDAKAIAQLSREQRLFREQESLQARLQGLAHDKRENLELQERYAKLLQDQTLNNPQYGDSFAPGVRLSTVTRAQALIQQNGAILQQLIEGYEWELERRKTDYSAAQLVDALPENQLFDITAELEQLERQRQEIEAQLDAANFVG